MYNGIIRADKKAANPRHARVGTKGKRKTSQEKLRLIQLSVCLLLFLAAFLGKGIFPNKLFQIRDNLLTILTSDTDFRSAFSALGESVPENSVFHQLEDFCIEVFGAENNTVQTSESNDAIPKLAGLLSTESSFLSGEPDEQSITDHLLSQNAWKIPMTSDAVVNDPVSSQPEQDAISEPVTVPAAGTLILKSDYNGDALPANYTMDQLSLGTLETITPVLGYINSEYGYREHPINGAYQFHGGVDISGKLGDSIQAFAAGTVEYVGEDDSYGLYLQLDHGNGVKSFYAHCSTICVSKGQTVSIGEKIAEIGSTGMSTGPHLHLELKYNKMHLNPIYYIEYLSDQ